MSVFRRSIVFFFPLLLPCIVHAQVSFSTKVSASNIAKNEVLEVNYEVRNGTIDDFNQPVFSDWQVVGGPNVSSSTVISNGDKSTSMTYQFLLKPLRPGLFKIPGARAVINGESATSNSLTVTVNNKTVANPQPPSSGSLLDPMLLMPPAVGPPVENMYDNYDGYLLRDDEDILEKTKKNLFVVVDVSKKTCYPGEAVKATYKLYSRVNMDAHITKRPSFNGFSSIDLPDSTNREFEIVERNGKQFKVYSVRDVQLYPLLTGKQTLQPVEIEARIQYKRVPANGGGRYDPFATSDVIDYPYVVKSEPVTVDVLPFPTEGKPADFHGVTGNFRINATVSPKELARNEAGSLKIEISGSGNWAMVQAPVINWPAGVDVYEPEISESLDSQAIPVTGKRVYAYPFSTDNAGKLQVPPVKFSFFNPGKIQYETISSSVPSITVSRTAKANSNPLPAFSTGLSGVDNTQIFTDIVSIAFPVAAVLLLFWLLIKNRRRRAVQRKKAGGLQTQIRTGAENNKQEAPVEMAPFQRFMPPSTGSAAVLTSAAVEARDLTGKPAQLHQWEIPEDEGDDHLLNGTQKYFASVKKKIFGLLARHRGIQELSLIDTQRQLLDSGLSLEATEKIMSLLEICERQVYSPLVESFDKAHCEALASEIENLVTGTTA